MYKIENLMSMLFKLSTVIYTCTCTFMSLTHSLKRQCTEKKQARNRKYTLQFKWQDQCRNKKIYCNEPQGSNKTYMYM
jgi:hypothetical protein